MIILTLHPPKSASHAVQIWTCPWQIGRTQVPCKKSPLHSRISSMLDALLSITLVPEPAQLCRALSERC
ncbi:unnamed protein product [Arctogadus glacialis]